MSTIRNQCWNFGFFQKVTPRIRSKKNFFELKKVLLIQKNLFWSKEIDFFTFKKNFLNQQNFFQFKEIFFITLYQRNVSLIQRNCSLSAKNLYDLSDPHLTDTFFRLSHSHINFIEIWMFQILRKNVSNIAYHILRNIWMQR